MEYFILGNYLLLPHCGLCELLVQLCFLWVQSDKGGGRETELWSCLVLKWKDTDFPGILENASYPLICFVHPEREVLNNACVNLCLGGQWLHPWPVDLICVLWPLVICWGERSPSSKWWDLERVKGLTCEGMLTEVRGWPGCAGDDGVEADVHISNQHVDEMQQERSCLMQIPPSGSLLIRVVMIQSSEKRTITSEDNPIV